MNDICYMLVSHDIDSLRIHGIFTHEFCKENGKELSIERGLLKLKHDSVAMLLIPLNHINEKGMII